MTSTVKVNIFLKGVLVNRDSMPKLTITRLESNVKRFSERENESFRVYSLDVKGAGKGTKNFAILYIGVPISDKIRQKRFGI